MRELRASPTWMPSPEIALWDVASGRQIWKVLGHLEPGALPRKFGTRVYGVAFSPDNAMLATSIVLKARSIGWPNAMPSRTNSGAIRSAT